MSYDRVFVKLKNNEIIIGYREDMPMPAFLGGPNAPKSKPLVFSIDHLEWLVKTAKTVADKMFKAGGQDWGNYGFSSAPKAHGGPLIQTRDAKVHIYSTYPYDSITFGWAGLDYIAEALAEIIEEA